MDYMRSLLLPGLFAISVGFVLAHFAVLFLNQWYFASDYFWLKVGLLTPFTAAFYGLTLISSWRWPWLCLGFYWLALHLGWIIYLQMPDLRDLTFAGGLNFETAFLWPVALTLAVYGSWKSSQTRAGQRRKEQDLTRELKLRYRQKRTSAAAMMDYAVEPAMHETHGYKPNPPKRQVPEKDFVNHPLDHKPVVLTSIVVVLWLWSGTTAAGGWLAPNENLKLNTTETSSQITENVPDAVPYDDPEPTPVVKDRHQDLKDPNFHWGWPKDPGLPEGFPVPMHLREKTRLWLIIQNWRDGVISGVRENDANLTEIGHVLVPVSQVNRQGFTASGWAEPGTVCATAVNAIHLKTDHDYENGRGVIFSLLPVELADFDPKNYASYFNQSSSLFTDIPGGTGIFGGEWAPLVGSRIMLGGKDTPEPWLNAAPVKPGWVPQEGEVIVIEVCRRKYNPEWIEFENRFGGLIWVKELGLDPYPIGQVLKPVAGIGRFLGSASADIGRIRANHPGVLCISTSPLGLIGGFQIIPRDHAMSSEMNNARLRTQWMVVGPLWALDPSWEGVAPLFNDYFYPAFTPALNDDYSVNEDVKGAAVFLDRFTVRGRYSDDAHPDQYILLREAVYLDDDALVNLTHLRIYFPRG